MAYGIREKSKMRFTNNRIKKIFDFFNFVTIVTEFFLKSEYTIITATK